ncbi:pyruvate/2-oxoglutarate dehydrogenase complex dihydrolipoamide dehydrogenase (E3) component [Hymenobacter luteus]|uniref:Pyruvate/2-oxoglutarate dehydrogenase complex dihydrolipoamide dehydrogenase (E3) component n=2 Tax=Hymenobacter TaxID=89966 RepID=A0A7W9WDG2_9BACT|nr:MULTISPECIES: mercuric reductase [Hymenobacter]MBB4602624.1 pyruvate/2-oxoglutarate dehydrogenase complex dihydrolipoamide dehydrogenase (E3) component [Hymenobacter latericoloratus]MBB6060515.1 pyruvate/2-oxoglutarate dehydrogenase complex dihydrolipoamide dehydrogenase (E3) component [Hymenobacter luteus]
MAVATRFDAIIIGSGQAGNPLATALAAAGRKVALIEQNLLGGSCINYGCSPVKAMLASAERMQQVATAANYGIKAGKPTPNLRAIVERKDALIQAKRDGIQKNLTQEQKGITLLHGRATFTGARRLRVALADGGEQVLTAPRIFINTGTRAAVPPIEGLEESDFLTNVEILNLKELPEHLLILGGGYIGLEFGQMFRRFGSRVTIVSTATQLLENEDDDVCAAMQEQLAADGIEFVLQADVHRVSRNADGIYTLTAATPAGERRLRGTHLLVAVGREPNTDLLGLEAAGVATDEKGYVQVNERLQTNVRGVYALGDVHPGPQFTHISYDDYRLVRDNLLHGKRRTTTGRPVPYVVFTQPQLGRIGLNEKQAQEQKLSYRVATMPVRTIGRAQETGHTTGLMKVLVDGRGYLLGAAVFSEQGGEIMSMLQLAMAGGLTCDDLQDMVLAHPTWAEALNNLFSKLRQPG